MKFKFYWYISSVWNDGILRPDCVFLEKEKSLNIIYFILNDEGLGTSHLQKWIKNGLNEMDKIKSGEIADFDMWGQSLGAMISLDKVIVYWGNDEYPEQIMGFNAFYEILTRWLDFISSPADIKKEVVFFVDANL